MKSFDLFKKANFENSSKPTLLGAILSLIAIVLMGYVLLKQLSEYFFKPLIKKDTIIFQDQEGTSTIPTNIKIKFPNLPCPIISVDQEDLIGHHRLNIQDTLLRTPIDKNGKILERENALFNPHKTQDLSKAIENGEGCIISGYVPISKVQGDIHVSFHAFREVYSYIVNHNLQDKISVGHSFSVLNFGNDLITVKTLREFGMENLEENFNRISNLPNNEKFDVKYDFDYFIKIIPQVFENKYTNQITLAYQYSLTYKAKIREEKNNMPIIIFNYDYSPVAVKYTKEVRYFSHLITNICALLGGIFVIFSIINGIILRLTDESESTEYIKMKNTIN